MQNLPLNFFDDDETQQFFQAITASNNTCMLKKDEIQRKMFEKYDKIEKNVENI